MSVVWHDSLAGKLLQKTRHLAPCFCRSQPAGESSPEAMSVVWHYSLAGKLLQKTRRLAPCFCRSQPAGDLLHEEMPVVRHDSLAGKLLIWIDLSIDELYLFSGFFWFLIYLVSDCGSGTTRLLGRRWITLIFVGWLPTRLSFVRAAAHLYSRGSSVLCRTEPHRSFWDSAGSPCNH